jgi:outer membrane protein assembly factor BamB
VLHEGLLIVVAAAESQSLVGLDAATGREVWRQEAASLDGTWGTPTFTKTAQDRTEMVLGVPKEIWGLDPLTGKLRWFATVNEAEQANSSIVIHDGVAYGFTGRGGGSAAVKVGGQGDATESHVLWTGRDMDRFGSPIFFNDRLYLIANGMVNTINPQTGERIDQARLEGAARSGGGMMGSLDYASPVIAGNHLYYLNGSGQTFVFKLGETPQQVSVNRLTDEPETFGGTPAISQGRLLIRSNKRLYCVKDMGETVNEADNRIADAADSGNGQPGAGRPPGGGGGRGQAGGRGPGGGRGQGGGPGGRGQGGGRGFGRDQAEDTRPKRPARPTSDGQ